MHDTWARHYDFVYDQCFGASFWQLTASTLALVGETQPAPARVLDLGAGTGRIAVPLALLGYDVTAVECSQGMADVLARRAARDGAALQLVRADLRTLVPGRSPAVPCPLIRADATFDLVLATFTLLNYLVSDDDLDGFADVAAGRLRPGGRLVFDIASRRLFASAMFESEHLHRQIEVRQIGPNVFRHRDSGCGIDAGGRFDYDEEFTFRYWRDDEVLERLARSGLALVREVTPRFRESGSRWFVVEKARR